MSEKAKQTAAEEVVEPQQVEAPAETPVAETVAPEQEVAEQQGEAAAETPEAAPAVVESAVAAAAKAAEPVVEETQSAAEVPLTAFQKKMLEVATQGTPEQSGLIAKLNNYLEDMKPGKPMTGEAGVVKQFQLWRTIFSTIENAPAEQFKSLWSIILAFFHEYSENVFHESYVYRFSEHWKHSKAELDGFQRILNLIKVSADPKTRGNTMKQVDLDKTLAQPFSEEGRNRLLAFYKK